MLLPFGIRVRHADRWDYMKLHAEERAQTSVEMLLLIAGAIILAAIVGMYLKGAVGGAGEGAEEKGGEIIGS